MFAHSVDPHLQLFESSTNKIFFKSACSHSKQRGANERVENRNLYSWLRHYSSFWA